MEGDNWGTPVIEAVPQCMTIRGPTQCFDNFRPDQPLHEQYAVRHAEAISSNGAQRLSLEGDRRGKGVGMI